MNGRETAEEIAEQAAAWVARVDRSGGGREDEAELEAWLAGDSRRRGAYLRALSAWIMLDRASAFGAASGEEEEVPPSRSRRWWAGGAAAAALIAIGGAIALQPPPAQRIETVLGEVRQVPLADGSTATVNTATALEVKLRRDGRQIALDHGEAWFEVARDPARPFVVSAGNVRARAIGTAFSVRRTQAGADVQVTHGVVEVWRAGEEGTARRVSAGTRAFVAYGGAAAAVVQADAGIENSLAWRSGELVFDGDTLAAAAAEFNRYNDVKVRIEGPALAAETFVGRFRTREPAAFARAAATIFGARAETGAQEIILSQR
jgi:transmembrane sensor